MVDPTENVLRALINLEGSPDFQVIAQWITESYRQELVDSAEITEVHRFRWSQGRSQELMELSETIRDARRILHTLTKGVR